MLALAAVPAWAATSSVEVVDFAFKPASVQIAPGDTVTWTFSGTGLDLRHSVTSDDGQSESFDSDPGNPSPLHAEGDQFSHTFSAPGRFTYFCKVHPTTMKGTVVVGAPGEPPPAGDTTPPGVSGLEARGGRNCKRKARRCKPRKTRVSFTLSEDASVRMTFDRGSGSDPQPLERAMTAGENQVTLSTRRVPRGRYELALVATDAAGNESGAATTNFRVR